MKSSIHPDKLAARFSSDNEALGGFDRARIRLEFSVSEPREDLLSYLGIILSPTRFPSPHH
jgi:hypothetical protein